MATTTIYITTSNTLYALLPFQPPHIAMESFFQGWVSRLEQLLADLVAAPRDDPDAARALVSTVLAHCHDYYHEKSCLAAYDVLAVFSPCWLTPYERTFLWIAGWKPSMTFRLLRAAVAARPLSAEQEQAVAEMERVTAAAERALSEDLARIQEAMVSRRMVSLGGRVSRETHAETVEAMVGSLRLLVGSADALRVRTVIRLVEILEPVQAVDLLAVGANLQLRLRGWEVRRATAA